MRSLEAFVIAALLTASTANASDFSIDDARNLLRSMGSYAHIEVIDSTARMNEPNTMLSITSTTIAPSRLVIRVSDGSVSSIYLRRWSPKKSCLFGNSYCDINYLVHLQRESPTKGTQLKVLKTMADRFIEAILMLKDADSRFGSPASEARFAEQVSAYRASTQRPTLPDEARRFALQAEDAINDKNFFSAATFYEQAVGIAPWWPEGHFDRAMVLADIEEYEIAAIEMRHYLALAPEAHDAAAAQDRIYIWEGKAKNSRQ